MKSTGQKLILLSFILAAVAAAVVFLYLQSLKTGQQTVKKTTVLVASETIPARTLVDKEMIKEIEVEDTTLFADYLKTYSDITGKYTKDTIMKNEGFHKDKLLDKNSDELSIKLDNGHRAVSINATGSSGVSGLLMPGDFVDIVVYLGEKKDGDVVVWPDTARMILQNIQVLAIDKQLDREDKSAAKDDGKGASGFLITLSVKTPDIEKLALAENTGILKLALRPIKDSSTIYTDGTTWDEILIDNSGQAPQGSGTGSSGTGNGYNTYTVKRGDTLKKISLDFYGDENKYTVIKEANNIKDPNIIITGEILRIPILEH